MIYNAIAFDDELFIIIEKELFSRDTFSMDDAMNHFEDLHISVDEKGIVRVVDA